MQGAYIRALRLHLRALSIQYSLYKKIDTERVLCWNEAEEGSGKKVLKAWDERLRRDLVVESDVDEELLFYIPSVCATITHTHTHTHTHTPDSPLT